MLLLHLNAKSGHYHMFPDTKYLVLRASVVYTATPHTSAPGSNPGKDAFLIEGRGFEPHFQNVFAHVVPVPMLVLPYVTGMHGAGWRPVDRCLCMMEHVMCHC